MRSLTMYHTDMGLVVRERLERFKLEALSELVLRLFGGLLVGLSVLLWLVLPIGLSAGQMSQHALLAALFTAFGLVVYAYGSRGFRRQLSCDAKRGTLSLTKINVNDQARVVRKIEARSIESLFVRRVNRRSGFASLVIRLSGQATPIVALTGDTADLENVHRVLCDLVQSRENGLDLTYRRARARTRGLAAARI